MKKILVGFAVIIVIAALVENHKSEVSDVPNMNINYAPEYQSPEYQYDPVYIDDYVEDREQTTCPMCCGTGTVECIVCRGSGINSDYESYTSVVIKAMSKPYCEGCDGNGYITCGRCHGSGLD